jgi:hypothetical protein
MDATVDGIGDAILYSSLDAGGDKTVDASVYGIVSGFVNAGRYRTLHGAGVTVGRQGYVKGLGPVSICTEGSLSPQ